MQANHVNVPTARDRCEPTRHAREGFGVSVTCVALTAIAPANKIYGSTVTVDSYFQSLYQALVQRLAQMAISERIISHGNENKPAG